MESPLVGLVTCAEFPRLSRDDERLVAAFASAGLRAEAAVWDDPAVDWSSFSGLLIRSCWDYHTKLPDFLVWLESVERRCVPVWNSLPTLRWNVTKTYLKSCPAAVPTVWLDPGQEHDLDTVMLGQGWDEGVVKPLVGASAHKTVRIRRGDPAARAAVTAALEPHGAMLQPFLPEVQAEGEWSFVFVDGLYGHAVLKRPASGDFRVQEEHGGSSAPAEPGDGLIAAAAEALACVQTPWLYARVDAVRRDGALMISELELVEPSLYFAHGPKTAERLAQSVKKRL